MAELTGVDPLAPLCDPVAMNWRIIATGFAVVVAIGLAGCAPDGSRTAPVVMEIGDLPGATVQLLTDQVLQIDPGSLAADSIHGVVEDTAVAQFVAGDETDDGTWWPKAYGVAEGETRVVLSNSDSGIQDVEFTIEVKGWSPEIGGTVALALTALRTGRDPQPHAVRPARH